MMALNLIEAGFWLIICLGIIAIFYFTYCIFIGRQIFMPNNVHSTYLLLLLFVNPTYHSAFLTELSSLRFIGLGFLLPAVLILLVNKLQQGKYHFYHSFSLTKGAKAIAEHALNNLEIAYESWTDSTKLSDYENTSLLYSRKNNISLRQVQDKAFRQGIIKEIREIMDTYTRPSKKIGFLFLFLDIVLVVFVCFLFQIRI